MYSHTLFLGGLHGAVCILPIYVLSYPIPRCPAWCCVYTTYLCTLIPYSSVPCMVLCVYYLSMYCHTLFLCALHGAVCILPIYVLSYPIPRCPAWCCVYTTYLCTLIPYSSVPCMVLCVYYLSMYCHTLFLGALHGAVCILPIYVLSYPIPRCPAWCCVYTTYLCTLIPYSSVACMVLCVYYLSMYSHTLFLCALHGAVCILPIYVLSYPIPRCPAWCCVYTTYLCTLIPYSSVPCMVLCVYYLSMYCHTLFLGALHGAVCILPIYVLSYPIPRCPAWCCVYTTYLCTLIPYSSVACMVLCVYYLSMYSHTLFLGALHGAVCILPIYVLSYPIPRCPAWCCVYTTYLCTLIPYSSVACMVLCVYYLSMYSHTLFLCALHGAVCILPIYVLSYPIPRCPAWCCVYTTYLCTLIPYSSVPCMVLCVYYLSMYCHTLFLGALHGAVCILPIYVLSYPIPRWPAWCCVYTTYLCTVIPYSSVPCMVLCVYYLSMYSHTLFLGALHGAVCILPIYVLSYPIPRWPAWCCVYTTYLCTLIPYSSVPCMVLCVYYLSMYSHTLFLGALHGAVCILPIYVLSYPIPRCPAWCCVYTTYLCTVIPYSSVACMVLCVYYLSMYCHTLFLGALHGAVCILPIYVLSYPIPRCPAWCCVYTTYLCTVIPYSSVPCMVLCVYYLSMYCHTLFLGGLHGAVCILPIYVLSYPIPRCPAWCCVYTTYLCTLIPYSSVPCMVLCVYYLSMYSHTLFLGGLHGAVCILPIYVLSYPIPRCPAWCCVYTAYLCTLIPYSSVPCMVLCVYYLSMYSHTLFLCALHGAVCILPIYVLSYPIPRCPAWCCVYTTYLCTLIPYSSVPCMVLCVYYLSMYSHTLFLGALHGAVCILPIYVLSYPIPRCPAWCCVYTTYLCTLIPYSSVPCMVLCVYYLSMYCHTLFLGALHGAVCILPIYVLSYPIPRWPAWCCVYTTYLCTLIPYSSVPCMVLCVYYLSMYSHTLFLGGLHGAVCILPIYVLSYPIPLCPAWCCVYTTYLCTVIPYSSVPCMVLCVYYLSMYSHTLFLCALHGAVCILPIYVLSYPIPRCPAWCCVYTAGESHPLDSEDYLGIESLWNQKNYWVNMQDCAQGIKVTHTHTHTHTHTWHMIISACIDIRFYLHRT